MGSHTTLIHSPSERDDRVAQKRLNVLRFLRQEVWSTSDILQMLLNVRSRQGAHKSLVALERQGLIRRHQLQIIGAVGVTLWGITPHGQAMAFDPATEQLCTTSFEPSKVAPMTLLHTVDLQQVRVKAEAAGWVQWRNGDRLGAADRYAVRPDALAISPLGRKFAVEVERTIKSPKRYQAILLGYLRMLKAGEIDRVVWLCPDLDMVARLSRIIKSIQAVKLAGQSIKVDPVKHHVNLRFLSYCQWPPQE